MPNSNIYPGEPSILDLTTPRDNLRWALGALDLVANGLRNRRKLEADDVEMLNLNAAKVSVEEALRIIRSTLAPSATTFTSPAGLHPSTVDLVARFATALAEKLRKAEEKYGYDDGWMGSAWMEECQARLLEHVAKGDPRDVAAYCAFMWHHGWRTKLAAPGRDG